jgi:hypothetical protein
VAVWLKPRPVQELRRRVLLLNGREARCSKPHERGPLLPGAWHTRRTGTPSFLPIPHHPPHHRPIHRRQVLRRRRGPAQPPRHRPQCRRPQGEGAGGRGLFPILPPPGGGRPGGGP